MIKYRAGYKYQLAERYVHQLAFKPLFVGVVAAGPYLELVADGELTIAAGYAWDGPSGPTFDSKSTLRGSLVHDALFQLIRLGRLSRDFIDEANREYRRICREDGMGRIRAWGHFVVLEQFGDFATRPSAERVILSAP